MLSVTPALKLLAVAVVASLILGVAYVQTKPRIDANTAAKTVKAQRKVLPGADEYVEKHRGELTYYNALKGATRIGRVLLVRPNGYGGPIDMLVGIKDGKVTGVEVLLMKETPGFGDRVVTPKFTDQFLGRSASDPVELRKDIDAVSGATISSRALTAGVREALDADRKLGAE